jgi:hypothetical protein
LLKTKLLAASDSIFLRELKSVMQAIYSPKSGVSVHDIIVQHFAADEEASKSRAVLATSHLYDLAEKCLRLVEGNSRSETLTRSARILGTLQLTVSQSAKKWREVNFAFKPLYRTVLMLRLLSHMLENNLIKDGWILQHYLLQQPNDNNCPFKQNVQIPLIIAALLMDSGQLHPDAIGILSGVSKELDPLRQLRSEERKQFLAINKSARLAIANHVLTIIPIKANNREEKQQNITEQQVRLKFIKECLSSLDKGNSHLRNLLKTPQVYSSIVLPGRKRFVYEALPKAALLLNEAVRSQQLDASAVKQLLRITGVFPQGYGIVFVPPQNSNMINEKYELAIVNQLYPTKAVEPLCRIVSNNLMFRKSGYNHNISMENNLYFKIAREKLAIVPQQRLQLILSQLSADRHLGQVRHSLPRCWVPEHFFSQPEHQNLWNNAPTLPD